MWKGTGAATCNGFGDVHAVILLTRVPNLSLDYLAVMLNAAGRKFDTNGRLRVKVKLIACETAEQIGFANTRVTNDHHCTRGKSEAEHLNDGQLNGKLAKALTLKKIVVIIIRAWCCA